MPELVAGSGVTLTPNVGTGTLTVDATGVAGPSAEIASRSLLAAIAGPTVGMYRFLAESGREGGFVFNNANLSANVTSDPGQAIYVPPAAATSGASGAWVRRYPGEINVKWFGAKGDGSTDDTTAIQRGLNYINTIGGGTLYFPEGSYKVTAYLTIYKKTIIRGANRKASIITTAMAGGGGANTAENVRNGSIFYSNWPSNSSTAADIVVQHIGLTCTNGANVSAGFYDNGGSFININNVTVTGFKYGVILDQSELADIDLCDFEGQGLAGVWLVNGADLKVGNSSGYTNRISVKRSQFNEGATVYGILDDGGYLHVFEDNNYNGCLNQIRTAGNEGLEIRGGEWEGSAGACVRIDSATLAGNGVGGPTGVMVTGGFMAPGAGQPAIISYSGSIGVGGGVQFSTSVAAIQGGGNGFFLTLGYAIQRVNGVALTDGWGTVTNLPFTIMSNSPSGLGHTSHHRQGEVVWNNAPATGAVLGWRCTVTGAPGTWETIPNPLGTSAIGYVVGAGGAVTQITSKATGVTLNKITGQITMQNAALAAGAKVSFVVTNSTVAATDAVIVSVASGGTANAYRAAVTAVAAGSFTITVENITAGSLSEAPVINFAVIKAVAA